MFVPDGKQETGGWLASREAVVRVGPGREVRLSPPSFFEDVTKLAQVMIEEHFLPAMAKRDGSLHEAFGSLAAGTAELVLHLDYPSSRVLLNALLYYACAQEYRALEASGKLAGQGAKPKKKAKAPARKPAKVAKARKAVKKPVKKSRE